jgi:hypothetical protein
MVLIYNIKIYVECNKLTSMDKAVRVSKKHFFFQTVKMEIHKLLFFNNTIYKRIY